MWVPVAKELSELGDCREFLMLDRGGGAFHRAGEKVDSMDDAIVLADGGLCEVVLYKLNGVRKRSALETALAT